VRSSAGAAPRGEECISGIYWLRMRVYQKVSGLSHKEIYAYNNKLSLRSNTKGHGGKTHETDSQNIDKTAPSRRELYHLRFYLQVANPKTFGYTLASLHGVVLHHKMHSRFLTYWTRRLIEAIPTEGKEGKSFRLEEQIKCSSGR
jgi:hypothetical protein